MPLNSWFVNSDKKWPACQPHQQLQALSWTKGGAILFLFFGLFLWPLLCKLSRTPCFQQLCQAANRASAGGSESPNDESSSPCQISQDNKSYTLVTSKHPCSVHQCTVIKYNVQVCPPKLAALCSLDSSWKQGVFLFTVCFPSVVPFYLYLVHVYIVSRIAQKRNNIKCIISVVLEWLLILSRRR